ncbi:Glu-tRNA(Gln) amidotransferase subunit GatD [Thermosphaera chiliense]|uniref:Glutamyl-tRNA(Gln) amidotransferase subunit D n=1 Tax=Thermosphaera chiliense TaxID=3402707 RepID=A0A7M1UT52_9CREN|nr:Glu-tRNA(Gln) amidotransferase subunit GatD [Thermosphaera aggregans]QOR94302.1 Glu-tRNA(Gln) amidotransferase subunit GatD [Thermosphaera aggregans]
MEIYHGYTGFIASKLREAGAEPGDVIRVDNPDGESFTGVLMPRQLLYSNRPVLVLKLSNGYNIGVKVELETRIVLLSKKKGLPGTTGSEASLKKPFVSILATGGTIASKVDYVTGAVTPLLDPQELLEWAPELSDVGFLNVREIMKKFSEDITPSDWEKLSLEVYREITNGAEGVVVAHGTDMMSYSAAALAFSIVGKPVPIVFVGSQRSSDRPSSDSFFNLYSAVLTAFKASFAESVIVMHGESSDSYAVVLRGVKARKMHTSRRDAFQPINDKPIALVYPYTREIRIVGRILEKRDRSKEALLRNKFDDKVAIVKAYPGLQEEIVNFLVDKKFSGIVIEGSGLGHVSNSLIDSLKRAVENEIPVVMTSQCLFGRVNLNVYSTGRRLLEAGVIPASDMLPETAYVKLSWILGSVTKNLAEVRQLMQTNIAGEINERHTLELYPRWSHE